MYRVFHEPVLTIKFTTAPFSKRHEYHTLQTTGLRHLFPEDFAFGASLFVFTATTSSFVKKCYKDVVWFKNVSHISYIYTAWRGQTSEFVFFLQFHPILVLLIPCLVQS